MLFQVLEKRGGVISKNLLHVFFLLIYSAANNILCPIKRCLKGLSAHEIFVETGRVYFWQWCSQIQRIFGNIHQHIKILS